MSNQDKETIPYNKHLISLLCVAIISVGGTYKYSEFKHQQEKMQEEVAYPHGEDLARVNASYEAILNNYVGEFDKNELVDGAIKGMTLALDDPYSDYFSETDSKELNESISGSFEGIGASMTLEGDQPKVAEAPIKDSPAEKAKLKVNDLILKVDGKATKGKDLTEVVNEIRGKKGTEVTLTIERESAVFDVTIVRDVIPVETVFGELDKDNKTVGSIRISTFTEHTAKEFQDTIKDLRKEGAKSFVLDVRGNPGGLLDQVAIMSSMFLKDGKTIVKFEDKQENKEELVAGKKLDDGFKINEPTVVLVDENSASASEIFAAALNESAKIEVIGTTTFGKGTVQTVNPLTTGSNLKLTTNKWLTPKGNWIHEKGFEPSIKIEFPAYYKAIPIDRSSTHQEGDQGEAAKNINLILAGLDFAVNETAEEYSADTTAAVKDFQEKNELDVTGTIDKETANKIEFALYKKMSSHDLVYAKGIEQLSKKK